MKTILSTSNLNIGYKSKKGVTTISQNLNLNLSSGKLISLIGANGIGKSTLLRTITGIQKPLSGNVYLNDKSISEYKPLELAQNLSLVLTEKLPPSNLSVFELVAWNFNSGRYRKSSASHETDSNRTFDFKKTFRNQ